MKIDKHLKDLSDRINAAAFAELDKDKDKNLENAATEDDDYYLDRGERPPRFVYYKKVRREKYSDFEKLACFDPDETITQDELDFILKRQLRMTPEERYQRAKRHYYWHELYLKDRVECNPMYDGCTPKCRYHNETGRIEDEEVIQEHTKTEAEYRKQNRIVDIPLP